MNIVDAAKTRRPIKRKAWGDFLVLQDAPASRDGSEVYPDPYLQFPCNVPACLDFDDLIAEDWEFEADGKSQDIAQWSPLPEESSLFPGKLEAIHAMATASGALMILACQQELVLADQQKLIMEIHDSLERVLNRWCRSKKVAR